MFNFVNQYLCSPKHPNPLQFTLKIPQMTQTRLYSLWLYVIIKITYHHYLLRDAEN